MLACVIEDIINTNWKFQLPDTHTSHFVVPLQVHSPEHDHVCSCTSEDNWKNLFADKKGVPALSSPDSRITHTSGLAKSYQHCALDMCVVELNLFCFGVSHVLDKFHFCAVNRSVLPYETPNQSAVLALHCICRPALFISIRVGGESPALVAVVIICLHATSLICHCH